MVIELSEKQKKEGWQIVKFGEIAKQCKESVERENNPFERYVEGGHMDTENLRITRWGEFGDHYVGPAFHRIFRKGQILYGSRRTYLKKVAVAEFDGITANTTFVIESQHPEIILPGLLPFLMLSEDFTNHSVLNSKGSTNPYINWGDIAKYEFPLPPIERQKEILAILQKSDSTTLHKSLALQSSQRFRQVLLRKTFSTEKMISGGWKQGKLTDIASYQNGKAFPSKDYCDKGVKLLRPGNIDVSGTVEWGKKATKCLPQSYWQNQKDFRIFGGEIVMNLTAQSLEDGFLGRVCRIKKNETCLLNQRVARISPRDIDPDYLFWFLQSPTVRRHIDLAPTGTKVKHLYNADLENIPIFYPKSSDEQILIGKVFNELDFTIRKLQKETIRSSQLAKNITNSLL